MSKATALAQTLAALEKLHGRPAPPPKRSAFEWVLWENVAYLADDERRARAFAELEARVGLAPAAIAAARKATLVAVADLGGIFGAKRAERLREAAALALEIGDLTGALAEGGAAARKLLKRFPTIGEPGAEKILLCTGVEPVLALDSNGLRVLLRLGYGQESANYARAYRSARDAAALELPKTVAACWRAHALLRRHGQQQCKRSAPACDACPLALRCAHRAGRR